MGEAWTLLVLREAFKGAATFGDFEQRLPIVPTTLTRRLDALCIHGLLRRQRYQTHPPRDRYELTDKALDLLPVLVALGTWGNRWLAPEGELMTVVDAESGVPLDVAVVDRTTARPVRAGEIALKSGPGAPEALRTALKKPLVLGRHRLEGDTRRRKS
jgi:DNA-binding HxlR family transcriptional regulator